MQPSGENRSLRFVLRSGQHVHSNLPLTTDLVVLPTRQVLPLVLRNPLESAATYRCEVCGTSEADAGKLLRCVCACEHRLDLQTAQRTNPLLDRNSNSMGYSIWSLANCSNADEGNNLRQTTQWHDSSLQARHLLSAPGK